MRVSASLGRADVLPERVWRQQSPGILAPQGASMPRCEIEAARPLRAACRCPAGARMVP